MRILSVANQKGGCGKTTVAVNLASAFQRAGKRVLVLDNDPQGHATLGLGVTPGQFSLSTRDLYLTSDVRVLDARLEVHEGLDVIPAEVDLAAVEQELVEDPRKVRRLLERLAVSEMPYDLVIIDNPPQVGLLTFNALMVSGEALVPVDASRFSLEAVERFQETLGVLERERGHRLAVHLLACGFDVRTRHARLILEELDERFPNLRLSTLIHHTVRIREAAQVGKPIDRYDAASRGAFDFAVLADELETVTLSIDLDELDSWETMLHGPRPESEGVRFSAHFPEAEQVAVTGDFTEWSVEGVPLAGGSEGRWSVAVPMDPGCYEYKFIVDGVWKTDPENPEKVRNSYGQINSVLVVPAQGAP